MHAVAHLIIFYQFSTADLQCIYFPYIFTYVKYSYPLCTLFNLIIGTPTVLPNLSKTVESNRFWIFFIKLTTLDFGLDSHFSS